MEKPKKRYLAPSVASQRVALPSLYMASCVPPETYCPFTEQCQTDPCDP